MIFRLLNLLLAIYNNHFIININKSCNQVPLLFVEEKGIVSIILFETNTQ